MRVIRGAQQRPHQYNSSSCTFSVRSTKMLVFIATAILYQLCRCPWQTKAAIVLFYVSTRRPCQCSLFIVNVDMLYIVVQSCYIIALCLSQGRPAHKVSTVILHCIVEGKGIWGHMVQNRYSGVYTSYTICIPHETAYRIVNQNGPGNTRCERARQKQTQHG